MNEDTTPVNGPDEQPAHPFIRETPTIDWEQKLYGCPRYADEVNQEAAEP